MIDDRRWERLVLHLLDECDSAAPIGTDPTISERAAVRIYSAIYHQLQHRRA